MCSIKLILLLCLLGISNSLDAQSHVGFLGGDKHLQHEQESY